jgi:hypothetical protein
MHDRNSDLGLTFQTIAGYRKDTLFQANLHKIMGIALLKKSLKENNKELVLEALRSFHKSS